MGVFIGSAVDVPPIGAWVRSGGNPVVSAHGMPENIVFDPVTNKYWSPITNFDTGFVGLISSSDLVTWSLDAFTLSASDATTSQAPYLLLNAGTWFLYYSRAIGVGESIYVATCSTVNGTYSAGSLLLSPTGSGWERDRTLEPCVFQDLTGRWVMFYMGDANLAAGSAETVGYAFASSPSGPFTRYAGNPVLPFGAAGQFDQGCVADPHVYIFNGTYYIFYAAVPVPFLVVGQFSLGYTGYYTSTDLITFTKHGIALGPSGVAGSQDEWGSVRGGIIRVGNTYNFIYAGRSNAALGSLGYKVCIATLSAISPNSMIHG